MWQKMVNGGRVNNWICINFSRNVQDSVARGFCYELAQMCHISGMVLKLHNSFGYLLPISFWTVFEASPKIGLWFFMQDFALEPLLPPVGARPEQVERVLKTRYHDAMTKLQPHSKELDLLIVILPDNNGSLYGTRLEFCLADGGCLVLFLV